MPKLYDTIQKLLTKYPKMRDDDKELEWAIWSIERNNKVMFTSITKEDFMKCSSSESITRARRLVQAENPTLRPSTWVAKARHTKEATKGKFAYAEELKDSWQNQ